MSNKIIYLITKMLWFEFINSNTCWGSRSLINSWFRAYILYNNQTALNPEILADQQTHIALLNLLRGNLSINFGGWVDFDEVRADYKLAKRAVNSCSRSTLPCERSHRAWCWVDPAVDPEPAAAAVVADAVAAAAVSVAGQVHCSEAAVLLSARCQCGCHGGRCCCGRWRVIQ